MDKWADYLISQVSYTPERLIYGAIRHKDTNKGITDGEQIDRITLISDVKKGLSHITVYSGKDSWKKGDKIKIFSIGGNYYLRVDKNKVALDYLGSLPEIIPKSYEPSKSVSESDEATPEQLMRLEQLEQQIKKLSRKISSKKSSSKQRKSKKS